ncbi:MAG: aminoacyl-tRNA hydrolase, partial [Sphingomonadaceae bacterium]|nr:aminoacyl-tRNA hydrolase [Sphingomonadaceae bacterium]
GSRMTAEGVLVLTARRHRTQLANRADALARLAALLERAHDRPARRIDTRPSRAARQRRIDAKAARGRIKAMRGRPAVE